MMILQVLAKDDPFLASEVGPYLCGDHRKFFLRQGFGPGEIEVADTIDRDEMDMGVGDFDPGDHHTDFLARDSFLNGVGDLFGKDDETFQKFILDIKDVIDLLLWDDECVAGIYRTDIEKGEIPIVLKDLMSGDLPGKDLSKKSGHDDLLNDGNGF